jgi:hypothetical protein
MNLFISSVHGPMIHYGFSANYVHIYYYESKVIALSRRVDNVRQFGSCEASNVIRFLLHFVNET